MTKTLKQILLVALFAAIAGPALAASSGIDYSFKKPEDVNRNLAENPALFGLKNSSGTSLGIPSNTNYAARALAGGLQWVVGQGVLEDIYLSTGTSANTDWVVCFDSAATTNANPYDVGFNVLFPPVKPNATDPSRMFGSATSGMGTPIPLSFKAGLYCIQTGTTFGYTPVWRAKGD